METTKTETLVERFNNAEITTVKYPNGKEQTYYPVHSQMEFELARLLGYEIQYRSALGKDELLKEYKEHFEWDTEYGVYVRWEVEPASYTQHLDCSSLEETKQYLQRQIPTETPEWDEEVDSCLDYGSGFTGDNSLEPKVSVSNLRLKKAKFQYAVQLVVDCEEALPELDGLLQSAVAAHIPFSTAEVVSITANT
tara:strand:- start:2068 stop:2652 length:585 start_codon:yes stop_codon:yes gene_type:complete